MSFNGYYIKIGNQTFQNPAIKRDGLTVNSRIVQVTETKVLASGKLVLKELPHKPTIISVTFPIMTLEQARTYAAAFRGTTSGEDEMYLTVEWYDFETDTYQTGTFYHTDLKYKPVNVAPGQLGTNRGHIMVECETVDLHEY